MLVLQPGLFKNCLCPLLFLRLSNSKVKPDHKPSQIEFSHLISLDIYFDFDIPFLSFISALAITTLALGEIPPDDGLHAFTTVEGLTQKLLEFNYATNFGFNPNFPQVPPGHHASLL